MTVILGVPLQNEDNLLWQNCNAFIMIDPVLWYKYNLKCIDLFVCNEWSVVILS